MNISHGDLYHAAAANDTQRFRELVQNGADVEESYEDDMNNISTEYILHVCCAKGRLEMVQILVDAGAKLNVADSYGQTPLMYCIVTQYLNIAEVLLSKDSSIIDDQDCHGKTPLHIAAENGYEECVQMLISHNAEVDMQTLDGFTPLMVCCYISADETTSLQILRLLIKAGAEVNLRERKSKRTALQMAGAKLNLKATEILLDAGADPNMLDGGGRSAITNVICSKVRPQSSPNINPDILALVVMFIQSGANLNLKQCELSNPLITAVSRQAEPLVALFLSHGADVNITFSSGTTAILVATTKYDLPNIKLLIYYNTRLDMKGNIYRKKEQMEYHFDAMEYAIFDRKFDLVELFYQVGYNLGKLKYLYDKSNLPVSLVENVEMQSWLKFKATNPRSLLDISIIKIRSILGLMACKKVEELPLPTRLKDFLLLKHILDVY